MRHADMTIFARLLLLVPLVAACAQPPAGALDGRTFLSTSVTEDGAAHRLVAGTQIRLSFTDGRVGASVGCNIYGATYRIQDGRLVASGGSMTEMGCDEDRAAQDEWLFAFLGSNPSTTLNGDELRLESAGTIITLLDREVADPDLPLVGPTWKVVSVISGGAVSSVPAGVVASLIFQADGLVSFQTGCNSGGGRFSGTADELRLSELVMTKRACDGAEAEMEAVVIRVLQAEAIAYRIEAGGLTLSAGGFGLQLTGR